MATPIAATQILAEIIKRILPHQMATSLDQMAAFASVPVGALILQIVEKDVANFRLKNMPSDFLVPERGKAERIETKDNDHAKTKLRPPQIQRILFLAENEMSADAISQRMNVSQKTIRRILAQRGPAANRTQVSHSSASRSSRGAPIPFSLVRQT